MEALSGDPERPFTRAQVKDPQGTFAILVPIIEGADSVHVWASPSDARLNAAREIARVSLNAGPDKNDDKPRRKRKGN
jgi:hypothetical protein